MWALECSKLKADWDMRFIEQRKLWITQLNRGLRTLSAEFNNVLHGVLRSKDGKSVFTSQAEQRQYLDTLEHFQLRFSKGVEVTDLGVKAGLITLSITLVPRQGSQNKTNLCQ
jgi:hypothetical protein